MGRPKGSNKKWQGLIFNGCEILTPVDPTKTGSMDYWHIKCYCGNLFERWATELKREPNASCGCGGIKRLQELSLTRKIDYHNYIDQETGIILIEPEDPELNCSYDQWIALCPYHEIPVEFLVRPNSIRTGHTKSCGCLYDKTIKVNLIKIEKLRQEKRLNRGLNKNEFLVSENILIRESLFKPIRHLIFKLDNFTCQKCYKKESGLYFNAHHIIPLNEIIFNDFKSLKLSYDLSNIITLCKDCHLKAHAYTWQNIDVILQKEYLEYTKNRIIPDDIMCEYNRLVNTIIIPRIDNYLQRRESDKQDCVCDLN